MANIGNDGESPTRSHWTLEEAVQHAKELNEWEEERAYARELNLTQPPLSEKGFIYILEALQLGAVKIGWTREFRGVGHRTATCKTYCPDEIVLAAFFPGSLAEETTLHDYFRPEHIRGERFVKSPAIDELIQKISDIAGCHCWLVQQCCRRMPFGATCLPCLGGQMAPEFLDHRKTETTHGTAGQASSGTRRAHTCTPRLDGSTPFGNSLREGANSLQSSQPLLY